MTAGGAAPEGACCCICLSSVESLQLLSCLSCVCEGVFHEDCLERVPRTEEGALLRRCPNCREPGSKVRVKDALDAYLGSRGLDEAEEGPLEVARLRRHLRARTQKLQNLERSNERARVAASLCRVSVDQPTIASSRSSTADTA